MKAKHLLLIAAVAVFLLVLRVLLVGPEEQIRREMAGMAEEASKRGPQKPILAAASARSISGRFAVDAEAIDLTGGQGVRGRDAIARAIGWARESWDDGDLAFEDLEVELQGEESARARALVRILDPAGQPASPYDGTRVRFDWAKVGGDWETVRAEADLPPGAATP